MFSPCRSTYDTSSQQGFPCVFLAYKTAHPIFLSQASESIVEWTLHILNSNTDGTIGAFFDDAAALGFFSFGWSSCLGWIIFYVLLTGIAKKAIFDTKRRENILQFYNVI